MKTRNGFVSNSSSSSFILLGARLNDIKLTEEKKKEIMTAVGYGDDDVSGFWDIVYDGELGLENPTETNAWGLILATGDECGEFDDKEFNITELAKDAEEIKVKIKNYFGVDTDIKIITGTYSC